MNGEDIDGTAIHEAGHAVVAVYAGASLDYVDVGAGVDAHGRPTVGRTSGPHPLPCDCRHELAHLDERCLDFAEREIVVLWAGPQAEIQYARAPPDARSADLDYANVERILGMIGMHLEEWDEFTSRALNDAEALVRKLELPIKALARRLATEPGARITRQEISCLLASSGFPAAVEQP